MVDKIRGASDVSKTEDALGLDTYLMGLADYIRECETPMTISIQGDWGTGKTTFFNLVEKKLNSEGDKISKIPVIEVNTWQFSVAGYEDNMVYVLIQLICNKLEELLDNAPVKEVATDKGLSKGYKALIDKVRTTASSLGPVAAVPLASVLEKTFGSIATEKIYEFLDKNNILQQNNHLGIDAVECLRSQMEEAIEKICDVYESSKLLIFIDDLDRLEPKSAVELLEGLKNFLDCDKCVFVLALDQKVVFRGVEAKYGSNDGKELGTKFFDKIIQMPFTLPMASYDVSGYIEKLRPNDTWKTQERYLEVIELLTDKNPRTLKRLFNMLLLHEKIENISSDESDKKVLLLAILALSLRDEKTYETLVTTANEKDEKELKDLITKPKSKYLALKKILDSTENLSDDENSYQLLGKLLKGSVSASVATHGEELNVGGDVAPLFNKFTRLISRNSCLKQEDKRSSYKNMVKRTFKADDGASVGLNPENAWFNIVLHDTNEKYKFLERIQQDAEKFEDCTNKKAPEQRDKLAYKASANTITIWKIDQNINYDLLGYLYDNYISKIGK